MVILVQSYIPKVGQSDDYTMCMHAVSQIHFIFVHNGTGKTTLSYPLPTSSPRKLGTCTVKPSEGIALQDKFAVNCSGFSSKYLPLTYIFYLDPGKCASSKHGELI